MDPAPPASAAPQTRSRPRVAWWVWFLLLGPACCTFYLPFCWAYEKYEIRKLQGLVEGMGIPGAVEAVDGRNDWNGNSNGAYVRVWWIVAAADIHELDRFAERVSRTRFPHELQAEVWKLPTSPNDFLTQNPKFLFEGGLYVLRVEYGRENAWWELSD